MSTTPLGQKFINDTYSVEDRLNILFLAIVFAIWEDYGEEDHGYIVWPSEWY